MGRPTWTRFDGSHQVDCPHHWTGERLVNADIQTATGLDGNPPFGGRLDPATGEWSRLPHAPDVEDGLPDSITVNAARGPRIAGWGFVYDDVTGTWTPYGRPDSPVDRQTGATWAGRRLVVVGGLDEDAGYEDTSGLSDETWIWSAVTDRPGSGQLFAIEVQSSSRVAIRSARPRASLPSRTAMSAGSARR